MRDDEALAALTLSPWERMEQASRMYERALRKFTENPCLDTEASLNDAETQLQSLR